MTVSLNIKPGIEKLLVARAKAIGLPLERFIEGVLEREAVATEDAGPRSLTGAEKAAALRKWANSFPMDLPILSLDDTNRESIYRQN